MNKKSPKKLKLHSETIRQLNTSDLKDIAGGVSYPTRCAGSCPCYPTEYASCWC